MTRPDPRLAALRQLTAVVRDAELARVRAAAETCARIETALTRLDELGRMPPPAETPDPALLAGQEALWRQWHRAERARLQAQLAVGRATLEAAKARARRALGRDEVVGRLLSR